MTHTPEPWEAFVEPQEDGEIRVVAKQPYSGNGSFHVAICSTKADADRIANCVNGCDGLNPAAYRACVEALKDAVRQIHELTDYPKDPSQPNYAEAQEKTLALATGGPS